MTADVVELYTSMHQETGLMVLKKYWIEGRRKKSLLRILSKWLSLCLRITTLSSTARLNIKYQVFPLNTYRCIFIGKIETEFLQIQEFQSLVWFRYIDNIFFNLDRWSK